MNYEIQTPKEYTEEIRKLEVTDPGNAETTFNPVINKLINNDAYLKEYQDETRRVLEEHTENEDIHVTAGQKSVWTNKAEKTIATSLSAGLMSTSDKVKLDGVAAGAEVNQNAFQTIRVGGVDVQAKEKTAQIEIEAGTNLTIFGDHKTNKIVINGPSMIKNPEKLTVQFNGNTVENYDGGTAKTINITPLEIGAAPANHNHTNYLPLTGGTVEGELKISGEYPFHARYVDGNITGGMDGKLYLNYNRTAEVYLGTNGGGVVSADGRQYSGNAASATNADMVDGKHASELSRMGGRHLAGQGSGGGYSFAGEIAEDTGMFSDADGDLYFKQNGVKHRMISDLTIGTQSVNYANSAGSANTVAWGNVSGKPNVYTPAAHTHDERYYTEAEVNSQLTKKADRSNPVFTNSISLGRKSGTTVGYCSTVLGDMLEASGMYSYAEGCASIAYGYGSHATGSETVAKGATSSSHGSNTIAAGWCHFAIGKFNKDLAANTSFENPFMVGGGSSEDSRANLFRVNSAGNVYAKGTYYTGGADYAEYFEWVDQNSEAEDRVGYFVTCKEGKIQIANPGDYILGVISSDPSVLGNSYDDQWKGREKRDVWGRIIYETVEYHMENSDEVLTAQEAVLTKEFDNTKFYIPRSERPEWSPVGMLGVLRVRDDGSCRINEYCQVANGGIATAAADNTEYVLTDKSIIKRYRVMERVTDNIIKIIFR